MSKLAATFSDPNIPTVVKVTRAGNVALLATCIAVFYMILSI
jgi:hypothetical protein